MRRRLLIAVLMLVATPAAFAIDPIPTCDPCLDCMMLCSAWPWAGCYYWCP